MAHPGHLSTRDQRLKAQVARTPEERASDEAVEAQPYVGAELERAITHTKSPRARRVLEQERLNRQKLQAQRLREQVTGE